MLKRLKEDQYVIIVIEQTSHSAPLDKFHADPSKEYCLVFGNEVHGISEESLALADQALEIPQHGTKHSLNVSVCLGIVAWEFFKQL